MPTISKLIAAFMFAAVGLFAAEAFKPSMPEGTQFGYLTEICAGIGFLCGWIVMGRLTGKGYRASAGSGLRTSVTLAAWALLISCIVLMVRNAFKMRYDTPMQALVDIFGLALEHGALMLSAPVLGTLGIGGVLGGLVAEWFKRRWD